MQNYTRKEVHLYRKEFNSREGVLVVHRDEDARIKWKTVMDSIFIESFE